MMRPGVVLMTLMNAVEGRDAAFNDWYERTHLDDVLDIPGMIRADRYKVAGIYPAGTTPWTYLTIYEVHPDRVDSVVRELSVRRGTDAMRMSPALDEARLGWFFEKISERSAPAAPALHKPKDDA